MFNIYLLYLEILSLVHIDRLPLYLPTVYETTVFNEAVT